MGGWRSAAEVESVGEVASEGARYLRLLEVDESGEGRIEEVFCLVISTPKMLLRIPAGCFETGSVLVFLFLARSQVHKLFLLWTRRMMGRWLTAQKEGAEAYSIR